MVRKRVFLVEDDAIVASTIANQLQSLNYNVTTNSFQESLSLSIDIIPDLIIIDVLSRDKFQSIQVAKSIYDRTNKPLIYLSRDPGRNFSKNTLFSGIYGYIFYPCTLQQLESVIELALMRYEMQLDRCEEITATENYDKAQSFMSFFSHEFRNPLTQIKAWSQLLQKYESQWETEKKKHGFEQIGKAVNYLNALVEDILVLGQTESSLRNMDYEQINLIDFCHQLIQSHQLISNCSHQFNFCYQEGDYLVSLNEILLKHILDNLISNAIKYSPVGGVIRLLLFYEGQELCFKVIDQGIGIPRKDLAKLWEPFQRGSNVGNIPGTGLGLIIAQRSAKLLGGTMEIVSEVNRGTEVTVRIFNVNAGQKASSAKLAGF